MTSPQLPQSDAPLSEADVEMSGIRDFLDSLGYFVKPRKAGFPELDAAWPTKTVGGDGQGEPDFLLFSDLTKYPLVVWENKGTAVGANAALDEAKAYIEGAHRLLRGKPNLPRVAAGYDGIHLKSAYLTTDNRWVPLKEHGLPFTGHFPNCSDLRRGVRNDGNIVEPPEALDAQSLRSVFEQFKGLYRGIPALKSGRRPIDFTVALLTLRLVVEREEWGSWAEQPSLVPDAPTLDQQVSERFVQLVVRCMANAELRDSYGSIFKFHEQDENESEVAFDFESTLKHIPTGKKHFERMFELLDTLPLLHGADIDIFGEVYQAIGDDAVKRAFGEYFTGRHIIAGLVPVMMARAGIDAFEDSLQGRSIADIACGTGGFLTETLRFARQEFDLSDEEVSSFAQDSFYGYDLSASSASRARVNMYFAGDGFSAIEGGVDSLDRTNRRGPRSRKFDFILTNPPYGSSSQHRLLHEAFLTRVIDLLKPGTGWGLVVLPTGTLENPRSINARFELLKAAQVTDVISLPKHAFAPYTTQRTGVVIFRKRPKPLADTTWEDLLKSIHHEKVSMFVVNNDGYANSDKRFPTGRKDLDGSWLHDDLSPWMDSAGDIQPSKLMAALINEDGAPSVYKRLSLKQLREEMQSWGADRASGVELLPDSYLAPRTTGIDAATFVSRASQLFSRLKAEPFVDTSADSVPILEELSELLSTPIALSDDESQSYELQSILTIRKGNPGLTEAAIYEGYDPAGVPVYGGGVSKPAHRIRRDTKTSKGQTITVFDGPAIVLSVDGSSGSMQVVGSGQFAANHHAAVLKPKSKDVNLHLVTQQAEARLKALASNKTGSASLTGGTIKSLQVRLPLSPEVAEEVASVRARLTNLRRALT